MIEFSKNEDFDSQNSCRFCLEIVCDKVTFTQNIQDAFENLTNIKLNLSQLLPNKMCQNCNLEISRCSASKNKFTKNQEWLQDTFFKFMEERELQNKIKTEPTEFEENIQEISQANLEILGATQEPTELYGYVVKSEYEIMSYEQTLNSESSENSTTGSNKNHFSGHVDGVHSNTRLQSKNFKCTICDRMFNRRSSMYSHRDIVHLKKYEITCEICQKTFGTTGAYNRHLKSKHPSESPLTRYSKGQSTSGSAKTRCSYCGIFVDERHLKNHVDREHLKINHYFCDLCPFKNYSKQILSDHMKTHLNRKDIKCTMCDRMFNTKNSMLSHNAIVHLKKYQISCKICQKTFGATGAYNRHLKAKHPSEVPLLHKSRGREKENIFEIEQSTQETLQKNIEVFDNIQEPTELQGYLVKSEYQVISVDQTINLNSESNNNEKFKSSIDDSAEHVRFEYLAEDPLASEKESTEKAKSTSGPVDGSVKTSCSYCGILIAERQLNNHINRVHLKIFRFFCDQCPFKNYSKFTLRDHMQTHSNSKNVKCTMCDRMFNSKRSMYSHRDIVHMKKYQVTCEICQKTLRSTSVYNRHMKSQHPSAVPLVRKSRDREKEITGKEKLTTHETNELQTFLIKSENQIMSCDQTLNTNSESTKNEEYPSDSIKIDCFDMHLKSDHYTSEVQHDSKDNTQDEKTVATRPRLRSHVNRVHIKSNRFLCDLCPFKHFSKSLLVDHMKTHLNRKTIKCTMCDRMFRCKNSMTSHRDVVHLKKYQITCEICQKICSATNSYKRHMKAKHSIEASHYRSEKINCPQCGKTVFKNKLDSHNDRHHLKTYRYFCDLCPFKNYLKCLLVDHMKTHLKRKDVKCTMCDRKFNTKKSMLCHRDIVHFKKYQITCEVCQKTCRTTNSYKRHMKALHTLDVNIVRKSKRRGKGCEANDIFTIIKV